MSEEDRYRRIEKKLDEHGQALNDIRQTLNTLAVQSEQIQSLRGEVNGLWRKWDGLIDPATGSLTRIQNHQASCPRGQVKWLWTIIIPQGITIIALGIAALARAF